MKRKQARVLKDIIDQALQESGLAEGLETLKIHKAWDEVIGKSAAQECTKRTFRSGRYTVHVASSVLRCQLDMQKIFLKERLNIVLGSDAVQEIIIR